MLDGLSSLPAWEGGLSALRATSMRNALRFEALTFIRPKP